MADALFLAGQLRSALEEVTDEQRLLVLSKLENGICRYCGKLRLDDQECHCTNDG